MEFKKMAIPLVDLQAQYQTIRAEIDQAIERIVTNTAFIGGSDVKEFEKEFAAYCEAKACVGVGNGTDALYLALRGLGIGPGDEVITASHTFIATSEAISQVGARPVFVEIENDTLLISPDAVEAAITPNTKAIIAVHIYGQPCDMDRLMAIAQKHGLKVVEDAAQAHGARWKGQRVGSLGHIACFSFYPGKNLGAYGDGGAVVSNDEDLIKRVRMLANHGRLEKYTHEIEGVNSRLDGLQAAILRVKLPYLDKWNARRDEIAKEYMRFLKDSGVRLPVIRPEAESGWHLFVIRVQDREGLQQFLKARGVSTGVHYPIPLHRQQAYEYLQMPEGSLPITEKAATEIVSLPLYSELTDSILDQVVQAILDYVTTLDI
jgi:dTDP-4-amino-4,6-dideoxygalactose transaminase